MADGLNAMRLGPFLNLLIALLGAPLLIGVVNRTKAFFAGRRGAPVLQLYFDLAKLLRKGAVYSRTTTWVFRAGPVAGLAAVLLALTVVPFGNAPALVAFPGDFVLLASLLALMRFVTILAALDTGSSFEGMGASREALFSALAEPALLIGLAAIARDTGGVSLSDMLAETSLVDWSRARPAAAIVSIALFVVFLAENSRIPVDDPDTHLELTMIHEVMVLDHGGPDLALILYGAALKFWALGSLLMGIVLPATGLQPALGWAVLPAGLVGLAVATGIVESSMARLRLIRVPQLLVGASALSVLALVMTLR